MWRLRKRDVQDMDPTCHRCGNRQARDGSLEGATLPIRPPVWGGAHEEGPSKLFRICREGTTTLMAIAGRSRFCRAATFHSASFIFKSLKWRGDIYQAPWGSLSAAYMPDQTRLNKCPPRRPADPLPEHGPTLFRGQQTAQAAQNNLELLLHSFRLHLRFAPDLLYTVSTITQLR